MSSGTSVQSDAGRKIIAGTAGKAMATIARLGMSPRQQQLNHYYAFYRCAHYDARRIDWDGRERSEPIDHEAIATAGFIPPGFYDAGASFPLKFRRPTAPYNLVKVIVDRFTGLLFSESRHPQIRVEGSPVTEDFLGAVAEAARLWQSMIRARMFGGSMGTAVIGFQFIKGKPVIEVHDPRWMRADFINRSTLELNAIEKRYMFPQEVQDPETGAWVQVWFWYRRVIDGERDVLWKPIPVGEGDEPDWEDDRFIEAVVEHNLGFCPVIWVQNLPVDDDIDGDPDCHGVYDMVEAIDGLISQANRGIIANCDPTVVIVSPDNLPEVRKGNENAIKLTSGSATYMEAAQQGPRAALEMADLLRKKVLEVSQVVLEGGESSGGSKTAIEIQLTYSSMTSKADVLREQYGERCVKPLLEMIMRATEKVTEATHGEDGIVRGSLVLPDKISRNENGDVVREPRKMGPGGPIKLQWPGYVDPSLGDVEQATRAAGMAKSTGLVDADHAAKFVANYFDVEDVKGMLTKIKNEADERMDALADQSLAGLHGGEDKAEETSKPLGAKEVQPGSDEEPKE